MPAVFSTAFELRGADIRFFHVQGKEIFQNKFGLEILLLKMFYYTIEV
jgi:hypothetical protein